MIGIMHCFFRFVVILVSLCDTYLLFAKLSVLFAPKITMQSLIIENANIYLPYLLIIIELYFTVYENLPHKYEITTNRKNNGFNADRAWQLSWCLLYSWMKRWWKIKLEHLLNEITGRHEAEVNASIFSSLHPRISSLICIVVA